MDISIGNAVDADTKTIPKATSITVAIDSIGGTDSDGRTEPSRWRCLRRGWNEYRRRTDRQRQAFDERDVAVQPVVFQITGQML